ncbi:MAG: septal ring lytic transglycosylase RlpA family protein [Nitrospiraceae bacterium]
MNSKQDVLIWTHHGWEAEWLRVSLILLALLLIAGCSTGVSKRAVRGGSYPVGYMEQGIASWYGPGFHGNLTANGERYDMHKLTAAHRTLPMGSIVRVRSLTNGRRVTVRINDRGPFVKGRIIDLSLEAAKTLRMTASGIDPVEIKVTSFRGQSRPLGNLTIQVASFSVKVNAQALAGRLREDYSDVSIQVAEVADGRRYRVFVGHFTKEQQAEIVAERLASELGVQPVILRDDT